MPDNLSSILLYIRFVKGKKLGHGTGFNMDEDALLEMEQCHGVVVASAIFGTNQQLYLYHLFYTFVLHLSHALIIVVCFYLIFDQETMTFSSNQKT